MVAAFSYPEDQIIALMQAEPGSRLIVDQQNLMTRTQSRIAVHFVGCQWLEIDAGRFFTRVYEKSEPFGATPPAHAAVRVYMAEETGRIVQEDLIGSEAGLTLIDTR